MIASPYSQLTPEVGYRAPTVSSGITVHRGSDAVDLTIRSIVTRYPLLDSRGRLIPSVSTFKKLFKE